jgi:hypothetical protein
MTAYARLPATSPRHGGASTVLTKPKAQFVPTIEKAIASPQSHPRPLPKRGGLRKNRII